MIQLKKFFGNKPKALTEYDIEDTKRQHVKLEGFIGIGTKKRSSDLF